MSPVSSGKQKEKWKPLDKSAVIGNWLGVRKVKM
jgi:hypothetical protein